MTTLPTSPHGPLEGPTAFRRDEIPMPNGLIGIQELVAWLISIQYWIQAVEVGDHSPAPALLVH